METPADPGNGRVARAVETVAMKIFYARAEPVAAAGPSATAIVVAEDPDEALLLLRKDLNFSGYRLPPAELVPYAVSQERVRLALGEAAAHEKGVYDFTVTGPAGPISADAPPAAIS